MKISCSKSALLSGIQTVIRALPAKSTMSIMECILINTNGGKITLTVNNLDLGIETVIEGNIEEAYKYYKISADMNESWSLNKMGEYYRKRGDYKTAFMYYNKAIDSPINEVNKLSSVI